jgi:hypothetical protein
VGDDLLFFFEQFLGGNARTVRGAEKGSSCDRQDLIKQKWEEYLFFYISDKK